MQSRKHGRVFDKGQSVVMKERRNKGNKDSVETSTQYTQDKYTLRITHKTSAHYTVHTRHVPTTQGTGGLHCS